MSQRLARPGLLSKTQFLPLNHDGTWNYQDLTDRIYDNMRAYRRDHCAIFIDSDSADDPVRYPGLDTSYLDPQENWHWTGANHRKKLKRAMIGDYEEWFQWFMKWQRFNAFQILVLIGPIQRMVNDERRGYLDGLITRLLKKPSVHRILVVEEDRFQPLVKSWLAAVDPVSEFPDLKGEFGKRQFREAIVSLLYGTSVYKKDLLAVASTTLSSKVLSAWETELEWIQSRPAYVRPLRGRYLTTGYYGREMVEGLETEAMIHERENPEEPPKALFQQRKDVGPSELSETWIEGLVEILLDSQGWFTLPALYNHVNREAQRVMQSSSEMPKIFNDHFDYEMPGEHHVFLPSRATLRKIAEKLVANGKVAKTTWVKEIGRPAIVYHMQGRLPFDAKNHCGQCAFYMPLRRQCRIWWLLTKSYGPAHPRWARDGQRPLSAFDLHKMKNAWRMGPHSSACSKFIDKKKDYTRKALPEDCDVCLVRLSHAPTGPMTICTNCRTRYFMLRRNKVRVLTSYEHEFNKRYQELAGTEAASDMKRLIEEWQGSAQSVVEKAIFEEHRKPVPDDDAAPKTVMVFPGDKMLSRDGRLFILKKRSLESIPMAGSTLVEHGGVVSDGQRELLESAGMKVRSIRISESNASGSPGQPLAERYDIAPAVEKVVQTNPEFVLRMALAMAQSAINATERVRAVAGLRQIEVQASIDKQRALMRRLERAPPGRSLVFEAAVMKEYWDCFFLAINPSFQRFGPRKKARFVREFVANPAGRARGYTAVDAAINYLHQRRLFKARSVNIELGLDPNPGEGFLHRKRWNPEGLSLVLDLIDPFKFADREKLLEAILDFSVNWRDFYGSTDRHGARFYYPRPEAVGVLEAVGEAADKMPVAYEGETLMLAEAYRKNVSRLIQNLQACTPLSFVPFAY